MTFVLAAYIAESATNPGTGTVSLGGALTGRRTFIDAVGDANTCPYYITDGTQAEWGIATIAAGTPNTLARTTVDGNTSGTTAKLNFTGSVTVYSDISDARAVFLDNNNFIKNGSGTYIQRWSKGADVASAAALALGNDGNYFDITGTTAITSIATKGSGTVIMLHFDAALTLTHHATDLILPGGTNITTAAGDEAMFVEYASGDWRCLCYTKAASIAATLAGTETLTNKTLTSPSISGGAFTGQSGFPAGSAGAPSIIPTGDTNTGTWFPAADTIAWSTGGTERARIISTGLFGINTSSLPYGEQLGIGFPGTQGIHLNDSTAAASVNFEYFTSNGTNVGAIYYNGSVMAYQTTSDYRLKQNVAPIVDATGKVLSLKPRSYQWKKTGRTSIGFIAHELQAVIPDAVSGKKDDVDAEGNPVYQGVDNSTIVPLLTAALQEAITEINALKARVAKLEGTV